MGDSRLGPAILAVPLTAPEGAGIVREPSGDRGDPSRGERPGAGGCGEAIRGDGLDRVRAGMLECVPLPRNRQAGGRCGGVHQEEAAWCRASLWKTSRPAPEAGRAPSAPRSWGDCRVRCEPAAGHLNKWAHPVGCAEDGARPPAGRVAGVPDGALGAMPGGSVRRGPEARASNNKNLSPGLGPGHIWWRV